MSKHRPQSSISSLRSQKPCSDPFKLCPRRPKLPGPSLKTVRNYLLLFIVVVANLFYRPEMLTISATNACKWNQLMRSRVSPRPL